jgi:hypothetical protein
MLERSAKEVLGMWLIALSLNRTSSFGQNIHAASR